MNKVLVIDDEPNWLKFCLSLGFTTIQNIAPDDIAQTNYDLYIVSDHQPLATIAALNAAGKRFMIATGNPTTRKAIEAYRLGAVDYIDKDFRAEVIMAAVEACKK